MASNSLRKAPFWFSPLATAALLWFVFACLVYYALMVHAGEDFDLLPEPLKILRAAMPFWMMLVYAASVGFGLFGGMSLLMRMTWAPRLFLAALIATIVQSTWMSVKVPLAIDLETLAFRVQLGSIGVTIVFAWLSRFALRQGWLI